MTDARSFDRDAGEVDPSDAELESARAALLVALGGAGVASVESWPRRRERRLVRRILQLTTREDLRWRGDVRLFANYLRDRLGRSRALRWVAASLLVHLVALPVCAWLAGDEGPARGAFHTGIEPAREDPFGAAAEAGEDPGGVAALPASSLDADGSPPAPPADRVHNTLQRHRFFLHAAGTRAEVRLGSPDTAEDASLKIRLLAARRPGAALEGGPDSWLDDGEAFARADDLERLLWLEVLLDHYVLRSEHHALLGAALNRLAQGRAAPSGATLGLAWLERAALGRARAYGLWEAPVGFDPERAALPWSAAWLGELERAWSRHAPGPALPERWRASAVRD